MYGGSDSPPLNQFRSVNKMSIRVLKPVTNGTRNMSVTDYSALFVERSKKASLGTAL